MRALVTGAAGFIGSHLCEELVGEGWEVIGVDDYSTGIERNLAGLAGHTSFDFYQMSVRAYCDAGFPNLVPDVVFHLAAHLGVDRIATDPLSMVEANAFDTQRVAEFALNLRALLVFTSTSEVYGQSEKVPMHEDDVSVLGASNRSRWGYAVSKLWAEHYVLCRAKAHGLKVVVPRLFNVSGPRQRHDTGMVLPRFAYAAVRGRSLEVHGDGSHLRCFAHVDDVVRALIDLTAFGEARGRVINVGSSVTRQIGEVACDVRDYVAKKWGISASIAHVDFSELDPQSERKAMKVRMADTTRLREILGRTIPDRHEAVIRDVCEFAYAEKERLGR
jgi:UDP-glucose 4-epimerase